MRLLLRWAIGAAALYATVWLGQQLKFHMRFDGGSSTRWIEAFIVVAALTLVNALIRPIVKLLTLPLSCLTFGLFGLVVNALMFWLVGQLDLGLVVKGFPAALFGSIVTSILFGVLNTFLGDNSTRDE